MTGFLFRVFSIGPKRMRVVYPVAFAAVIIGGTVVGFQLRRLLGLG